MFRWSSRDEREWGSRLRAQPPQLLLFNYSRVGSQGLGLGGREPRQEGGEQLAPSSSTGTEDALPALQQPQRA